MPRGYNRRLATKQYVHRAIQADQWSPVMRVTRDFQADVVNGGAGTVYNLTHPITQMILAHELYTRYTQGTDGYSINESDFTIDYIRVHIRCALGESETTSAVSQTVRFVLYRQARTFIDFPGTTGPPIVKDVDAMPEYGKLYGEINGLYWDKTHYIHSWAADHDTTAGGQVMFKKVVKPKYTDTMIYDHNFNVDTAKSILLLQIVGDDPDGSNAQLYGWFEVGFRYKIE